MEQCGTSTNGPTLARRYLKSSKSILITAIKRLSKEVQRGLNGVFNLTIEESGAATIGRNTNAVVKTGADVHVGSVWRLIREKLSQKEMDFCCTCKSPEKQSMSGPAVANYNHSQKIDDQGSSEPEEVQELLRQYTHELKSRDVNSTSIGVQ